MLEYRSYTVSGKRKSLYIKILPNRWLSSSSNKHSEEAIVLTTQTHIFHMLKSYCGRDLKKKKNRCTEKSACDWKLFNSEFRFSSNHRTNESQHLQVELATLFTPKPVIHRKRLIYSLQRSLLNVKRHF